MHAFLTVWSENDDGSWSIFCENHPVMKCGKILISKNILCRQEFLHTHGPWWLNQVVDREDEAGRVVVYNRTTKNIWVS
ncbi:unnamed protein product, partial [Mesorhabditis belari]|uniref:Uncharacterized protein n=1 Tax=Mesorhabditis belari TaxID=2138241 RepID=A0AAF3EQD3_9BILA